MTLAIAVAGINGRVGQRLAALIGEAPDLTLAGGLEQGDTALPPGAQVLVDFSSPEGFGRWLAASRAAAIPFVSGTTGLADAIASSGTSPHGSDHTTGNTTASARA